MIKGLPRTQALSYSSLIELDFNSSNARDIFIVDGGTYTLSGIKVKNLGVRSFQRFIVRNAQFDFSSSANPSLSFINNETDSQVGSQILFENVVFNNMNFLGFLGLKKANVVFRNCIFNFAKEAFLLKGDSDLKKYWLSSENFRSNRDYDYIKLYQFMLSYLYDFSVGSGFEDSDFNFKFIRKLVDDDSSDSRVKTYLSLSSLKDNKYSVGVSDSGGIEAISEYTNSQFLVALFNILPLIQKAFICIDFKPGDSIETEEVLSILQNDVSSYTFESSVFNMNIDKTDENFLTDLESSHSSLFQFGTVFSSPTIDYCPVQPSSEIFRFPAKITIRNSKINGNIQLKFTSNDTSSDDASKVEVLSLGNNESIEKLYVIDEYFDTDSTSFFSSLNFDFPNNSSDYNYPHPMIPASIKLIAMLRPIIEGNLPKEFIFENNDVSITRDIIFDDNVQQELKDRLTNLFEMTPFATVIGTPITPDYRLKLGQIVIGIQNAEVIPYSSTNPVWSLIKRIGNTFIRLYDLNLVSYKQDIQEFYQPKWCKIVDTSLVRFNDNVINLDGYKVVLDVDNHLKSRHPVLITDRNKTGTISDNNNDDTSEVEPGIFGLYQLGINSDENLLIVSGVASAIVLPYYSNTGANAQKYRRIISIENNSINISSLKTLSESFDLYGKLYTTVKGFMNDLFRYLRSNKDDNTGDYDLLQGTFNFPIYNLFSSFIGDANRSLDSTSVSITDHEINRIAFDVDWEILPNPESIVVFDLAFSESRVMEDSVILGDYNDGSYDVEWYLIYYVPSDSTSLNNRFTFSTVPPSDDDCEGRPQIERAVLLSYAGIPILVHATDTSSASESAITDDYYDSSTMNPGYYNSFIRSLVSLKYQTVYIDDLTKNSFQKIEIDLSNADVNNYKINSYNNASYLAAFVLMSDRASNGIPHYLPLLVVLRDDSTTNVYSFIDKATLNNFLQIELDETTSVNSHTFQKRTINPALFLHDDIVNIFTINTPSGWSLNNDAIRPFLLDSSDSEVKIEKNYIKSE